MKISPDFIPHEQFHLGNWLLSVKRPVWYYFMNARNFNVIDNPEFQESVDPPLRELVAFLHQRGIQTTPSCSGHHRSEKNFDKTFDALEQDEAEIRNDGLQLRDIESGKLYTYRNRRYRLPWTRDYFLENVLTYQERGVIGIRYNGPQKEMILNMQIPDVDIAERDSIIFIFTSEDSTLEIAAKWKQITDEIKEILK